MKGNRTPGKSLTPRNPIMLVLFSIRHTHSNYTFFPPTLTAQTGAPPPHPSVLQAFLGPSYLLHNRDLLPGNQADGITPNPQVGLSLQVLALGGPGDEEKGSLAALSFGSGLLTIEPSATLHLPCGLCSTTRLREEQWSRYMSTSLLRLWAWNFSSPTDL